MVRPQENKELGVYKLRHAGRVRYKLGWGAMDARLKWAIELKVKKESIEILDEGRKQ